MIQHVVLFRPKASIADEERAALIAALKAAVSGIPQIKNAVIGRRILLNRPGYEMNRTGFIGGLILREDVPDAQTQQVFPRAA